jgi:MFS family permease
VTLNRGRAARVLLGFVLFGIFWGAWGASLPAVQAQADAGVGTFGGVLLLIGAGALASMRLTGLLLDRYGNAVAPAVVVLFAACVVAAGSAGSAPMLAVALFALGALSGAFDVVINTAAVGYESATGRPLIAAAHAGFSAAVVLASALTGFARTAGADPPVIFAVVGAVLCVSAFAVRTVSASAVRRIGASRTGRAAGTPARGGRIAAPARGGRIATRLIVFGLMGALANLVENAQQSWSARHLEVTLHLPPRVSGLGPSIFALATVTARLAGQAGARRRISPRLVVTAGGLLAAAGTATTALAPNAGLCLVGVAVAGLGTGVCIPAILAVAGADVPGERRGAAVSAVMTVAYLGFAAGPAVVGLLAGHLGLRAALGAVAAIAVVLAVSAASVRHMAAAPCPCAAH